MMGKIPRTKFRKAAFTIAEVLITLSIIGIVASLTIPNLILSYQKTKMVSQLEKVYSSISQAIKQSEMENGPPYLWDYGAEDNGASTLTWFDSYLSKYFKYVSKKSDSTGVDVKLADGSMLRFAYHSFLHIYFFPDGDKKQFNGRNVFIFLIKPTEKIKPFTPFDFHASCADKIGTREYWTCDAEYGCNSTSSNKAHCAGLIMYDGWQVKSDYP